MVINGREHMVINNTNDNKQKFTEQKMVINRTTDSPINGWQIINQHINR